MTVPEALRVDTDGGIKPEMAFLALLFVCLGTPVCLTYAALLSLRSPDSFLGIRLSCLGLCGGVFCSFFLSFGSPFFNSIRLNAVLLPLFIFAPNG